MNRTPRSQARSGGDTRCLVGALAVAVLAATAAAFLTPAPAVAGPAPPFVAAWGNQTSFDDLLNPGFLAMGPNGHVYVADTGSGLVKEYTGDGAFVRLWGTNGYGAAPYSGLTGIAVDAAGRVYVTSTGAKVVDVWVLDDSGVTKVASFGSGVLVSPRGLAVGSNGDVYVADNGADDDIKEFTSAGTFVRAFDDPGQAIDPTGLAAGPSGQVYAIDGSGDRVLEFSAVGALVRTWGSSGTAGGQFGLATALAVGPDGTIHVTDRGTPQRVQEFTATGVFVEQWGAAGSTEVSLAQPSGVTVGADGSVYVAGLGATSSSDRSLDRVQKFTGDGTFVLTWGSRSENGRLYQPGGVTVLPDGNVAVADTGNSRIQVFTPTGSFVRRLGVYGTANGQLRGPADVTVDGAGNLWVLDLGNAKVKQFDPAGTFVRQWSAYPGATSLAVSPAGYVALTVTGNVRLYLADGTFVRGIGSQGAGDGQLDRPSGAAFTANGELLVADMDNDRVAQFTVQGGFVRNFGTGLDAPRAVTVDGLGRVHVVDATSHVQLYSAAGEWLNSWGPGSGTASGSFTAPGDLAVGADGSRFIADTGNDRVQAFATAPGGLNVVQAADETTVDVGDTIHVHLTITNAGDVPLTGVTVVDAVAPACAGPVAEVPVGATRTVDCTLVATAGQIGTLANVATVDTDQTVPATSNSVSVVVSGGSPRFVRTWWASPTGLPDGDPPAVGGLTVDGAGRVVTVGERPHRPFSGVSRFTADGVFVDRWADPAGAISSASDPQGVAVAPDGRVYVAVGTESGQVRRFNVDGSFDRSFDLPGAIDVAVGPDGSIFALSYTTAQVLKLSGDAFGFFAGGVGTGTTQLHEPQSLAVGPDGSVYVADHRNRRVNRFAADGAPLGRWGSNGTGPGQFPALWGIDVDEVGRVFVDDGTRMQAFTATGTFLAQWTQTSGDFEVHIDGGGRVHVYLGAADGAVTELVVPVGPTVRVTLRADVAQSTLGGTIAYTAQVDNIGSTTLTGVALVAPTLPGCAGPLPDLAPGAGRTVDCTHAVTLADPGRIVQAVVVTTVQTGEVPSNRTAVEVLPALVDQWGSYGAGPGQFGSYGGIALAGDVYVADCDNDRVQRFTRDGELVDAWGTEGSGDGQFRCPIDVARSGVDLLVLDRDNKRVQRFTLDGDFEAAWPTGTTYGGQPAAFDTDAQGNVYVVDLEAETEECTEFPPQCWTIPPAGNNLVRKFDASGTFLGEWGGYSSGQYLPRGVYVSGDGFVEVANTGRSNLRVTSLTGTSTQTVPLAGVDVYDVTEDGSGNLYVADSANNAVRKYTPGGTLLGHWPVSRPRSLAVDGDGRIYVRTGGRVVVIDQAPSAIQGTVTEPGGAPVAGAWVALLRAADLSLAGGAVADASGVFGLRAVPGEYRLYVIDPAGAHVGALHDATVSVAVGETAAANPVVAPTQGAIAGVVREQGTAVPVPGAMVIATDAASGEPRLGARADPSGHFTLAGLPAGTYRVVFVDPTGAHASAFHPSAPDPAGATLVSVVAGATTTADGALPTQTAVGGSSLTGTVSGYTGIGSAGPVAGAYVVALRASDLRFVAAAITDANGAYDLDVAPGDYKLAFFDPTGYQRTEWYDDRPYDGLGAAASVTAPAVTNTFLDRRVARFYGTVWGAGERLEGAWVLAVDDHGRIVGGARTAGGDYMLEGLTADTYRLAFADPANLRPAEYWNDQPDYVSATPVTLTAGQSLSLASTSLP